MRTCRWPRPCCALFCPFIQVLEAVLSPGELLLLPAHWMHQVEALGTSISVNFWVMSAAEHACNAVIADPYFWQNLDKKGSDSTLPHQAPPRSQRDQTLACVAMYLRSLVALALPGGSGAVSGWAQRLLARKYTRFFPTDRLPPYPCAPASAVGGLVVEGAIEARAGEVARLLKRYVQADMVEEYLAFLAEMYAKNSAGGPSAVPAFLRDCVGRL